MGYENSAEKRIEIFEDTMRLCRENSRLAAAVKYSRDNTKFYAADDYPEVNKVGKSGKISVTAERTLHAAKRLSSEYAGKKIAVLNFASATNPGGGVTKGSSAQEEALCRCSNLYEPLTLPYLIRHYYKWNQKNTGDMGSDLIIYSPAVTVFKSDDAIPENLSDWFQVDAITCAAPYYDPQKKKPVSHDKLEEVFTNSIRNIL